VNSVRGKDTICLQASVPIERPLPLPFIGGVSRKNNQDENVGVFLRENGSKIAQASRKEGGQGGCVSVEKHTVEGNNPKWRPAVCEGKVALCWSEDGEPWAGRDQTIVSSGCLLHL
jgi:hypothetical protein